MRQIPFVYGNTPVNIDFSYSDARPLYGISIPVQDEVKRFSLIIPQTESVRKINMPVGSGIRSIGFPMLLRDDVPAILGALDPYTLGDLDPLSIDFRMFDGLDRIVTNDVLGANGEGVFDLSEIVRYPFSYRMSPYDLSFNLGRHWLETWYIGTNALPLYLWNTKHGEKAEPLLAKEVAAEQTLYLANRKAELLSALRLWCKSVYNSPYTLGDADPYLLGDLDSFVLGSISRNVATALCIGSSSATTTSGVSVQPDGNSFYISNHAIIGAHSRVESSAVGKTDGLIVGKTMRYATLGDLDLYELSPVDARKLDMRFYSKVSAITTTD